MRLFRTAARAAVVTRVAGNTARRQQKRWSAEDAAAAQTEPAAPPAPPAPTTPSDTDQNAIPSMLDQLAQLGQLRAAGVLTEDEFETQKGRIIAGG